MSKYETISYISIVSKNIITVSFLLYLDLKDGLSILEVQLKATYGNSFSAPSTASYVSSPAAATASKMIKLIPEYEVYVPVSILRTSISYGKNGKEKE